VTENQKIGIIQFRNMQYVYHSSSKLFTYKSKICDTENKDDDVNEKREEGKGGRKWCVG
jgi:hypothetical protein